MHLDYETRESAQRNEETSIGRGVPVDGIFEVFGWARFRNELKRW